ncbi:hypothetical protein F5144DRAFT_534608 [Chaetomium tenue]|uniref:Uncharacterized protein n=1 Tax=Chaetomium tenue TaxID=1854479 RepID=A0ACB7P9U6_9PEZI|nr:hypothetical protein F5144DRAFT_534608 [Chaetomium globosum]
MQYLAVAALLLPATALASPVAIVRQDWAPAEFIGWTADQSCGRVSVTYDTLKQVANVTLPDYKVTLPDNGNRDRGCAVTLKVRYAAGACTTGTASGTVSGNATLPVGVSAQFYGRAYAVSPSIGPVSPVSPTKHWNAVTQPINERYTINDSVGYTFRPDLANRDVDFRLQGRLQLQPGTGPSGFLSNDNFIFDIRTQIRCCNRSASRVTISRVSDGLKLSPEVLTGKSRSGSITADITVRKGRSF